MSMTDVELLFSFAGGIGLFLFGMNIMAEGLQKAAGNKMKSLLAALTSNRLLAVLVGALVTAIIQSSSATTVMVVGFVNAGLMNLTQSVGVIMGANIGTTITSWLVSMKDIGSLFSPDFYAPLMIGIGAFAILFAKKERTKEVGQILIGFGMLFVGLNFMSGAIEPYRDSPVFSNAFRVLGENPFLGILVGALVTALIQSSSASVGILQALAINGMVTWRAAVFVTLGQNIGTCITAILSGAGAQKTAKRAAVIHLLFNVMGAVIFGVIMFLFFWAKPALAASNISTVQISIFHTIFNITNTIILFPFANQLVKASHLIIRDGKEEEEEEHTGQIPHLDTRILETPSFAIESAITEIGRMGDISVKHLQTVRDALFERNLKKIKKATKMEENVDNFASSLSEYLVKISNLSLTEQQHSVVSNLFYTVSNFERISDHCDNIGELVANMVENGYEFSKSAKADLKVMFDKTEDAVERAVECRRSMSLDAVNAVHEDEDAIDEMEERLRKQHVKRLSDKKCDTNAGIIFLDLLTNLERISDHTENIVDYVGDEIEIVNHK